MKSIFLLLVISLFTSLTMAEEISRPPLYVLLAFDGSKSLPMWKETRDFAKQATSAGKPVKFTYFINSTYYLANSYKNNYLAPQHGAGQSAIGFGGTTEEIKERYNQTNLAAAEKNEIANHAAGHYDGSKWSYSDWKSEFKQFFEMIFDKFLLNNHISYTKEFPNGWVFGKSEMIGFRAPQLGHNADMFKVLAEYNVKYDTSKTSAPNYWPKKDARGVWNFPLAQIQVVGTGRKTLSMNYNFYYMQSKALPDAGNSARYEEQMYQSYMKYIEDNYNGNRAPINIGHHFSLWNGGAYWRAMKRVALNVCGRAEVKCVTYTEYMKYLDSLDQKTILAYEKSEFKKAALVRLAVNPLFESSDADFLPLINDEDYLIADPLEAHDE